MNDMKDIAKFLFEVGQLKCTNRSGWSKEGIKNPESVAEHIFRTAIIGYILAKIDGADASKVMKMCLFHDIAEIRIGDLDKIMQRYIDKTEAERKALSDQISNLPNEIKNEMSDLIEEFESRNTKEALIAKDADVLEVILQAKEYYDNGYQGCNYWIEKNIPRLTTEIAKNMLESIKSMRADEWWKGLENMGK